MADRIVEIAWQTLLDCGPEHFTLDRLAGEARASKQTIYARFAGKAALLGAVLASRVDVASVEMGRLHATGSAQDAFTDLAHRVALAFSHPETVMFDRLIDWLDMHAPQAGKPTSRFAIYSRFHALMADNLALACRQWNLTIDDIPAAADFWIDGLYGHVRGARGGESQHREWAETFARYFLRAMRDEPA